MRDGAAIFTPAAGFSGEAGFDYTVVDGHGGSDTARVRIEVLPTTPPDPVVLSLVRARARARPRAPAA